MQMILDISDLLKKPAWTQTDDNIGSTEKRPEES